MAMIDYGAIAFKNGKLISTDMFTPMIDMVGWEDTENDVCYNYNTDKECPLSLKGNYFAYIGDANLTVGFYKTMIRIVERWENSEESKWEYFERGENNEEGKWEYFVVDECFSSGSYKWSKWELYLENSKMKVTKRNGFYVFRWEYKGDKYKVYFGHGVDYDYYIKTHMVNYYRSLEYIIRRKIPAWFEDKIYDIKYNLWAKQQLILPCKKGETVYRIVKFCEENEGYKEFYKPHIEFAKNCKYYEPAAWYDDSERCNAKINDEEKEPWYCALNLDILCEECKSRLAIQKDIFTLSMINDVFNTPMFNKNTSQEDIRYLSFEDAQEALNKIIAGDSIT